MNIQLSAFVGLRAFEIPQVQPQHVKRSGKGDSHCRLHVPRAKTRNTRKASHATHTSRSTPNATYTSTPATTSHTSTSACRPSGRLSPEPTTEQRSVPGKRTITTCRVTISGSGRPTSPHRPRQEPARRYECRRVVVVRGDRILS